MELFISGFYEEDALEQGYAKASNTTTWLAPEDFVKRCQLLDNSRSDQRWVWLYRGPWSLLSTLTTPPIDPQFDVLQQWTKWQRDILQLRNKLPNVVKLINRDSTSPHDLNTLLGSPSPLPGTPTAHHQDLLAVALSKLFDWIAPYTWEVFESLEAIAWMPINGTPTFRCNLTPPPSNTLQDIIYLVNSGLKLPKVNDELNAHAKIIQQITKDNGVILKRSEDISIKAQEREQELHNEIKSIKEKNNKNIEKFNYIEKKFTNELKTSQGENEQLLSQLHKTQEELETSNINNQNLLSQLKNHQKITQELKKWRNANELTTTKLRDAQVELNKQYKENEQLLKQLHNAHEEVEKSNIKNQNLLSQFKNHQKTTQELKKWRNANERATTQLRDAQGELNKQYKENEQLLTQLHKAQEELEKYYLANKHMQSTLTKSRKTMDQARVLLCKLGV